MDYSKYVLRTASCPAFGDWAIKNKLTVKWGDAKRGDIVLFDFNGNGTSDHIGIVTKATSSYIETIEGNTGSGSNTNGDGVYRRRRTKGQVNYFVRTKCPDMESVIRRAEAELGYKEGRNNSNKYGKWFGMNNVSWCCIFVVYCFAHALGETKPLPKPTGKYTGVIPVPTLKYGSEGIAVKNLQSFLNWYGCKLTVDGEFGSATQEVVKLFQKSEGISSDGIYGKKSYAKASAYKDSTSTTSTTTKYETYSGALPTKTIKQGSKGTQVTRWQKYLKWMGYSLDADGEFGGITKTKTIAAQKRLGFTGKDVDGIVGSKTIAKAKAYKKRVSP